MDEAGFDHEWPNFGEDFAVKGFAGRAEPTLCIGVDIAKTKVYDCAGFVGNAVEDIEVVQSTFGGGKKSDVVRCGERICLPTVARETRSEESESLAPKIFCAHIQFLIL
jgi:hypothetical protein